MRRRIRISGFSLVLLTALTLLFSFALIEGVWISAIVLGSMVILVGIKILADLAGAMVSLEQAFKMLPIGIPKEEKPVVKEKHIVKEKQVEKERQVPEKKVSVSILEKMFIRQQS